MRSFAFVLTLTLCLPACSAANSVKDEPPGDTAQFSSPGRAPTLESLLTSAKKGPTGWDEVSAALGTVFDLKALPGESLSGKGPARLSDGHVLSLVSINNPARQIDIGVAAEPCVAPAWAAHIVGARLNPVYQDAHGVDRGRQYDATANGMLIRFNTTPVIYRCVTSIHIYPAPKERP